MANSNQEQEARLAAAFGRKYGQRHIDSEAARLFGDLRTARSTFLSTLTVPYFRSSVVSNALPVSVSPSSEGDLSSDSAIRDGDSFYNRARNGYIYHKYIATGATSARDTVPGLKTDSDLVANLLKVGSSGGLKNLVHEKTQELVRAADTGDVRASDFDVDLSWQSAWNWVSGGRSSETSEQGVLQRIEENFIWFYYNTYISQQATSASAIDLDDIYTTINLEELVGLYLEIKIRKILLAADDALIEDEAQARADGILDQNGEYTERGRELLRQETTRRALQSLVPESERGSPEEQARLKRLAEQAFLIDFLPEFAQLNQTVKIPNYDNLFWMVQGHTDTIVNRLLHNPALENMDLLRPSEIASLVPKIRLFKVSYDTEEDFNADSASNSRQTYVEQEVPFANYVDPSEIKGILKSSFDRGRGVGLKSFDWKLQGENPFTARRDIFAELKLYFQSFDELLRERQLLTTSLQQTSRTFRYVDLVNIGVSQRRRNAWNPDYYKLRVEVGWVDPGTKNSFLGNAEMREAKREAIKNSRMVMYLTAIDHDIDINDEGNVTLGIKYVAWQEASYLAQDSDVLATEEISAARQERRAKIDEARRNCEPEKVDEIIQRYNRVIRQERYEGFQRIIRKLYDDQKIYAVSVPVASLDSYINFGEQGVNVRGVNAIFNTPRTRQNQANAINLNSPGRQTSLLSQALNINVGNLDEDGVLTRIQDLRYDGANTTHVNVQFFYFGDLIKVALENISRSSSTNGHRVVGMLEKDLRIVLGPFSYSRTVASNNGATPKPELIYNINLADIPISMNYYVEWFLKTAVSQQRLTYPILVFIRELAGKLLTGIMRDQAHGQQGVTRQSLQLRTNFFTGAADENGADVLETSRNILRNPSTGFTRINLDSPNIKLKTGPRGTSAPLMRPPNDGERAYHYMLLYAINTGTTQSLIGDPFLDRDRGIYHMGIGKDRGIFKRVTFSKTDLPGLRESRFDLDAESAATGLVVLKNVYNIDVKMVGNTLFVPGMKVFLDPSGISPGLGRPNQPGSAAKKLGIGGYHVVTGVQNYIEDGKFETSLRAIFEGSGVQGALGFPSGEQGGDSAECPEQNESRNIISSDTPQSSAPDQGPVSDRAAPATGATGGSTPVGPT